MNYYQNNSAFYESRIISYNCCWRQIKRYLSNLIECLRIPCPCRFQLPILLDQFKLNLRICLYTSFGSVFNSYQGSWHTKGQREAGVFSETCDVLSVKIIWEYFETFTDLLRACLRFEFLFLDSSKKKSYYKFRLFLFAIVHF